MSLSGSINKHSGDIRRAIGRMAIQGIVGSDGSLIGTSKVFGYVCAINEEGELAGTVDVQEFGYEAGEESYLGAGHHKGVRLSAIQDNSKGVFIVPMLYSEMVIVQNPVDGLEYVLMYSHAKRIRMSAHSIEGDGGCIEVGVTEVKDFVETDDGLEKDYDELEPTKNSASTVYTATAITDSITTPDDNVCYEEERTAEHKKVVIGSTTLIIENGKVTIETDGEVTVKSNKANVETDKCSIKGGEVIITGGKLTTRGTSSTDLQGPYNAIKVCPFSGAPHCGSIVSGT